MNDPPPRPTRASVTRKPAEPATDEDRAHLEKLLDRALADSFPASDPVSTLMPDEAPAASEPPAPRAP